MGGSWSSSSPAAQRPAFAAERDEALRDPSGWSEWFYRVLFSSATPLQTIMVGLDNAGKTTILWKLKLGETKQTVPTVGFNVETIVYNGHELAVFDVGGQDKLRQLWGDHYRNAFGIAFVVDASDRERLAKAREALQGMLIDAELRGKPLLVFANKQDLPGCMTATQLATSLGLRTAACASPWHVQACTSLTGDGLYPGLAWYAEALQASQGHSLGELRLVNGSVAELIEPWQRHAVFSHFEGEPPQGLASPAAEGAGAADASPALSLPERLARQFSASYNAAT